MGQWESISFPAAQCAIYYSMPPPYKVILKFLTAQLKVCIKNSLLVLTNISQLLA